MTDGVRTNGGKKMSIVVGYNQISKQKNHSFLLFGWVDVRSYNIYTKVENYNHKTTEKATNNNTKSSLQSISKPLSVKSMSCPLRLMALENFRRKFSLIVIRQWHFHSVAH